MFGAALSRLKSVSHCNYMQCRQSGIASLHNVCSTYQTRSTLLHRTLHDLAVPHTNASFGLSTQSPDVQAYIEGPYGAPLIDTFGHRHTAFLIVTSGLGWTFLRAWKRQLVQVRLDRRQIFRHQCEKEQLLGAAPAPCVALWCFRVQGADLQHSHEDNDHRTARKDMHD